MASQESGGGWGEISKSKQKLSRIEKTNIRINVS